MGLPTFYLILLTILWFLFYWILGGAFFALIAVFRLGKLKKARFSCLFSLGTLGIAIGAAVMGLRWGSSSAAECIGVAETNIEGFVAFFGCSVVALMMSFVAGAGVVLIWGGITMLLSSKKMMLTTPSSKPKREKPPRDESALS